MGGLTSVLSKVSPFLPVVEQFANVALNAASNEVDTRQRERSEELALKQLQQQQRLNEQQLAASNALNAEKRAEESRQQNEEQLRALRRAAARQRAAFGAQGISPASGSAEAVLLGMFEETDKDRQDRERLDNIRNRALSLGESQTRALNILQRTQLQQRNKLNNLSNTVGRAGNIIGTGLGAVSAAGNLAKVLEER